MKPLKITIFQWRKLIRELKKRGAGIRESGAFLLAKPDSRRIERTICYDELDQSALESGIVTFHARGFIKLWDICQSENLRVVADVHTHPASWVGQSEADRTHPMVAQVGHIALILPYFAQRTRHSLRNVGVYEYLGDHEWKTHHAKSFPIKITIL